MRLELVAAGCKASSDADAEFLSSWIVGCVCSMHVLADFRNALDLGVTAKHKLILESSSVSFVDKHRAQSDSHDDVSRKRDEEDGRTVYCTASA